MFLYISILNVIGNFQTNRAVTFKLIGVNRLLLLTNVN